MSASINISELAAELLAAPTNPRLRLVAASHGPWLLAAADALRGSADPRAAARLVALLLRSTTSCSRCCRLCRASPLLLGAHAALPAEQLLPQLAAASAAAGGVGVPPSPRLLRCAELLPLLMHPSPAARDAARPARASSASPTCRASSCRRLGTEAAAAPAAALRPAAAAGARRGAAAAAPEADALPARVVCVGQELVSPRRGVDGRRRATTTTILTAHRRRQRARAYGARRGGARCTRRRARLGAADAAERAARLRQDRAPRRLARRVGQDGNDGGGGNGAGGGNGGHGGVVVVHLDDLGDSKTLLGSTSSPTRPAIRGGLESSRRRSPRGGGSSSKTSTWRLPK